MSTYQNVDRDERTLAVENASYRWAYALVVYGLLLDVAYRGFRNEAAWDLMALVIGGGAICSIYQARQRIFAKGWLNKVVLVSLFVAVIAAIVAFALQM